MEPEALRWVIIRMLAQNPHARSQLNARIDAPPSKIHLALLDLIRSDPPIAWESGSRYGLTRTGEDLFADACSDPTLRIDSGRWIAEARSGAYEKYGRLHRTEIRNAAIPKPRSR